MHFLVIEFRFDFNLHKNWQNINSIRLSKPAGVELAHFQLKNSIAAFSSYILPANLK